MHVLDWGVQFWKENDWTVCLLLSHQSINQWLILFLCSEVTWAAVEDMERSDAVPCLWGIYNLAVDTRWPVLKTRREPFNAILGATSCTCNHISEKRDLRIKARTVWEVFMKSLRLGSKVLADLTSVHRRGAAGTFWTKPWWGLEKKMD